jgi:RHS repeat-associated protein
VNHIGAVVEASDEQQHVVTTIDYDTSANAYITSSNPDNLTSIIPQINTRFPGQYQDTTPTSATSEIVANGARTYLTNWGMYAQPEPRMAEPSFVVGQMRRLGHGMVYTYAANNPLRLIDKDGRGAVLAINVDFTSISPLSSGGGGAVGLSIVLLSDHPGEIGAYWILPKSTPSNGAGAGLGLSVCIGGGTGSWAGGFHNWGGNVGDASYSQFESDDGSLGCSGDCAGYSAGPPLGGYTTDTVSVPIFTLGGVDVSVPEIVLDIRTF